MAAAQEKAVTDFATYEDFLDSQVSPVDLYYLEVGVCLSVCACACVWMDGQRSKRRQ